MAKSQLEFVVEKLAGTKRRWPGVAIGAGIPVSTVRKIAQGQTQNPRTRTLQALYDYFRRQRNI